VICVVLFVFFGDMGGLGECGGVVGGGVVLWVFLGDCEGGLVPG